MKDTLADSSVLNLQSALRKANLLIQRCECWRLPKYYPINNLLPQLKDAVYEAENMVDELMYQGSMIEAEKSFPGTNFLNNLMTHFPTTANVVLNRLNNIYSEIKEICDIHGIPENPNKFSPTARPITSSFLDTSVLCGRDKELNEAIRLMGVSRSRGRKRPRNANMSNTSTSSTSTIKKWDVSVLSIVGIGGVGKTTLAQMVCNHEKVNSYFDLIMWVCVSDNFDMLKLTKEIIESATKKNCDLNNLDALQGILQGILNSKRFLLVLDDVWSKDWQLFLAPMKGASEGGVVMVTTRSHECVELVNSGVDSMGVINLEGLEEHFYWDLFKRYAFDSVTQSNIVDPEMEAIGKEICDRLKGSPLAAKSLGGILKTNLDVRHWRYTKNSKMRQLQQSEHDILPVLQLSYQYLPSHLKKCFSYCSIYPKGFKFTKWELTNFWIMQGFITLQQLEVHCTRPYVEEAEGYFHELVQRSFFQEVPRSRSGEYIINELMYDVCQSMRRDGCFCLEDADGHKNVGTDVRHLSVFQKKIKLKEQNEWGKYKKLRSFSVRPQSRWRITTIVGSLLQKVTNIRSLSLSGCKFKILPESIRMLKYLKYLDISFTSVESFPESFFTLYNLLYLNMDGCSRIRFFSPEFMKLVNLQFLYLPAEKLILIGHIENLAKNINCKNLDVSVGTNVKIENLRFMSNLNGTLEINNLEVVPSRKAAEEAHLRNKPLIERLTLNWSYQTVASRQQLGNEHHDEVLQGLCPHSNLKELRIYHYGGRNLSPSWLTEEFLPNLTQIEIMFCQSDIPIFHFPRYITKLVISWYDELTNLQNCFGPDNLPELKHLEVVMCNQLVSLPVESFGGFMSLEWLRIAFCSKLTCQKDMVLPPSLKTLELTYCGEIDKSLPSCLQNLTSLTTLELSGFPRLVSFTANAMRDLRSLSTLYVSSCTESRSMEGLEFLESLTYLSIDDCPELQSVGGLKFLASIAQLNITSCPKLIETKGQNIYGSLPSDLASSSRR